MKKTIICSAVFALVFGFVATSAFAAAPDVVVYAEKASMGKVTFNHKAHSTKLGDCAKCHEGTPAKIAINKEAAHGKACKECHTKMGAPAPTKCAECHKK